MRSKKILLVAAGVAATALIVFVFAFFQPHKIFIDDVVEEARPEMVFPTTTSPAPSTNSGAFREDPFSTEQMPQLPVRETLVGTFTTLDKATSGDVEVIPVTDTDRVLRLENFNTSNGPDLFVYLSTAPADGSLPFNEDFVNLGVLKGNAGNQNYDIPQDIDLSKFGTVVIWCERFTSAFGAAELTSAP